MSDSDDFGLDDDETAFIAVATQFESCQNGGEFPGSPRPTKKSRLSHDLSQIDGAGSEGDEGYRNYDEDQSHPCPTRRPLSDGIRSQASCGDGKPEVEEDREAWELGLANKSAKTTKHRIHVPTKGGQLPTFFFSQTQHQLDSSPGRIRGAVWKKPKLPEAPPLPSIRSRANGYLAFEGEDDAALAARLQAEEDASTAASAKVRGVNANHHGASGAEPNTELEDTPPDAFSSLPARDGEEGVIELTSSQPELPQQRPKAFRGPQTGLKQMTIFGQPATQDLTASQAAKKKHAWPLKDRDEPPTHHKLDDKAMETWVYPTNLGTIRDYQYNIVNRSLFHNTLVALPTGLGKTFIAATVMLNYYRWTKDSQIIFMAPTKPLIAQQMDACYHIVGITRHDTVLMTGETVPAIRAEEWLEKRVFFMTPQTVINDLKTGICDPKKIVLVVVDEAHKATGSYAYTEVITFLRRFNNSFRVLALTATPGSSVEAVQAVIDHLGIARTELRTEDSLDIRPYTHEKHTDVELFDYSDEQALIMDHMSKALRPVLSKLNTQNAYWSRDPMQLTAFGLTQARQKWAQSDAGRKAPMSLKGMVNSIFNALAPLAHSIGLLKNHGIVPFFAGVQKFKNDVESEATKGKNAKEIVHSEDFVKMVSRIRAWTSNPDFIGHPKLDYLRQVILAHFLDAGEGALGRDAPPSATRVMVFASYRDSTEEICRVLKRSEPMIRPHVFVGQAASSAGEGMNQKRQNEVIQEFKAGKYNTLVATSIGEEGLDIGDVDLIVCYDASSSPIRMLQRIGRTGRKRVGKVVLLLMRGKEENDYAKAQDNYAYIQKSIADASRYTYREDQSPRILPKNIQPVVDKRVIEIPIENSQPVDLNERGRKTKGKQKTKKPPKKFNMPDNVRTGFIKASRLGSDGDERADDEQSKKRSSNKAASSKKEWKRSRQVSPAPEVAQLPFLEDVLLTAAQKQELERRHARTFDRKGSAFYAPDFLQRPDSLRQIGPTKYVPHGKAARVVFRAMNSLQHIDDAKISRLSLLAAERDDVVNDPAAQIRLVGPLPSQAEPDEDLPPPAVLLPPNQPRPRSQKPQTSACKISYRSAEAAEEGSDSEPEPTPADMRIGTQGIDLGSEDTSGEDANDDEEVDSDLDAFIAKSDEVIETVSSSLPIGLDDVSDEELPPNQGKLRRKGAPVEESVELFSDADEDTIRDGEQSHLRAQSRKKRLVVESDSD